MLAHGGQRRSVAGFGSIEWSIDPGMLADLQRRQRHDEKLSIRPSARLAKPRSSRGRRPRAACFRW